MKTRLADVRTAPKFLMTNMCQYAAKINVTKADFVFFYSLVYGSVGSLVCMEPPDLMKNDTA